MAQKIPKSPGTPPAESQQDDSPAGSKWPLYILVAVIAAVVVLLAVGAALEVTGWSLPKIEPWVVLAAVVLVVAFIAFEVLLKPGVWVFRDYDKLYGRGSDGDGKSGAPVEAATVFLMHGGKLLLMRRSKRVGSYRGMWAGVSGHIEGTEDVWERAKKEIEEETSIAPGEVTLMRRGEPAIVDDGKRKWRVHPFLAQASTDWVLLNWEHTEYRWIAPADLPKYETVPEFRKMAQGIIGDWEKESGGKKTLPPSGENESAAEGLGPG